MMGTGTWVAPSRSNKAALLGGHKQEEGIIRAAVSASIISTCTKNGYFLTIIASIGGSSGSD